MPRRSSSQPPEAMTWGEALPILITAGILDLLRMFFEMFWFFGPAMAGIYCAAKVSGIPLLGSWLVTACAAGAAATGTAGMEISAPFGVLMAEAVGLATFLILGLWIVMSNARIFKTSAIGSLWFVGGFALSEIPLIGTIPAFSVVLFRLYRTQIRVEQVALDKWWKEHASELAQGRQQQAAQLMQYQQMQLAQAQEQEAANDAQYAQAEQEKEEEEKNRAETEAANDAQYDAQYTQEEKKVA